MGKGGNTQVKLTSNDDKNTNEKMEILLHGKYYDLTNFKHPGGGVIKFYMNNNIDATEAFNNFHLRSKKVLKILSHLPTRSNNEKEDVIYLPGQKKLLDDFNAFQDELKKEGYFEPSISHVCLRIFEILFLHAIGFYLLFNNHIILGTCILGLVSGRCGWLMHEGGHYSLTGKIALDKALQVVLYGIGCGMSASWWRSQHNRHHAMPQKLGYDVDLQTLPLVCFTEKVAKRVGIPMKWWLRIQAFSFPVVTTLLVALGWQLYLHPRHIIRSKQSSEALMFAIRYASIYYFIIGKFGWSQGIALYLFYNWFAATYIFINFAVSHTHLPTVAKDDTKVDWVRYSAIHTMNVKPGLFKWVDWWMGYLNYQIEHHLFPSMPQFRHPLISSRVKALFEKHGLKYDQRSYGEAMSVTFQNLHNVGHDVFYG